MKDHETDHYQHEGRYRCLETDCKTVVRRWYDLMRHYTVKHCKQAERFPCMEPGCQAKGAKGYSRRDKLREHQAKKHQAPTLFPKTTPAAPQCKRRERKGEQFIASYVAGSREGQDWTRE